eukprot:1988072-Ditylum_brightwellii.AAC.1
MPSAIASAIPTLTPTHQPTTPTPPFPTKTPTNSPFNPPTASPTTPLPRCPECFLTDEERRAQAFQTIVTLSDPAAINNPSTPQGKCFDWIVDQDLYCSCPQDPKLGQRYI